MREIAPLIFHYYHYAPARSTPKCQTDNQNVGAERPALSVRATHSGIDIATGVKAQK